MLLTMTFTASSGFGWGVTIVGELVVVAVVAVAGVDGGPDTVAVTVGFTFAPDVVEPVACWVDDTSADGIVVVWDGIVNFKDSATTAAAVAASTLVVVAAAFPLLGSASGGHSVFGPVFVGAGFAVAAAAGAAVAAAKESSDAFVLLDESAAIFPSLGQKLRVVLLLLATGLIVEDVF
jgi:hypothetical protein